MTLLGYARVSRADQDPDLQLRALHEAGCEHVWIEHASGARQDRPELTKLLSYIRAGDTLVVWKLDRLGRSLKHLVNLLEQLHQRGVAFRSLTEGMDTQTAAGALIFHVIGAMAEFERAIIRERTLAGLASARARGRYGGRRPVLTPARVASVRAMAASGEHTITAIAAALHISRTSVYRALAEDAP